jgi:hypothetical protein
MTEYEKAASSWRIDFNVSIFYFFIEVNEIIVGSTRARFKYRWSSCSLYCSTFEQRLVMSLPTVTFWFIDFRIRSNRFISLRKVQKDTCCDGWTGATCNEPICTTACVNGHCIAPDTCSCNTDYAGEACQYKQSMCC